MQNRFDIRETINGDQVVAFTSAKEMKTRGWLDASKVSAYLMDDEGESHKKHLGMINLFKTTHKVDIPFMKDLFADSSVLECGEGEVITYDLPVSRVEVQCYTAVDTSGEYDRPGIDGGIFRLILSQEFTKGDILTYDPMYYVTLQTQDNRKWFPQDKLVAGIQWMKIGHALAEYSTSFSGINLIKNPAGSITNEFILGSPRGVETFVTAKAANMKSPGLNAFTDDMLTDVNNKLEKLGGKSRDMFFVAKKSGDSLNSSSMRIGTTLEYLALMELALMECYSLLFAQSATIMTSNGVKRVNEGTWHQIRRGKMIKYARPGGITVDHLHEAASYVYKNSTIPVRERTIRFKAGWFAYQNMMQIFREEAVQQLNGLPAGMLGTDKQINDPVFSGNLDELKMQAVVIKQVMIPGLGNVICEHDPSLDYQPLADRFSSGMYGEGKAHNSYSLVMWDASSPEYSNVNSKVKNADLVEGGNKYSNIYYVKPEGPQVIYGYEQGRMADGGQTSNVMSSLKHMGKTFWATSQSGSLVLDTTRYVVIELRRNR
jgi:hypothetical protein